MARQRWLDTWVGRAGVMIPRMNQAWVEARKPGAAGIAPTNGLQAIGKRVKAVIP